MQLQIDCMEWVLEKIEVTKVPNGRLDGLIRKMIKDLEKRKDKAMRRPDTDDLWAKIETLQWVLYIIFAIKNERMVVINSPLSEVCEASQSTVYVQLHYGP
jgi:hypothetical protein